MKKLPDINILPVHELFLPVLKQKVLFTPYTIEQERNILTAADSKDIQAIINNYKKLIGECFTEPIDFTKLSAMEFVYMAVNLRCKSKGEVLEIETKCDKCKKPIDMKINIEDKVIIENQEKVKEICKIDDDLSFEVVPVRMEFLSALENIDSEPDLLVASAIYSINKVFWKEEIYDAFTPEELREKIKLTRPICMKIVKSINDLLKMKLVVEIKCLDKECGYKEDFVIRDFLKYLT
jgi:hypothetical protein